MSAYENPQIPEGINVSPTHPLKDFTLLLGGVSALIVVAVLALSFAAGYLVRFVPFEQEQALASSIDADWLKQSHSADDKRREQYLQALGEQLSAAMDLPAEMQITVHYSSDDTVNAMATLGGNIVVFQGLIDTVDSENALAMVLAHEIAHVRERDPISAVGRPAPLALGLLLAGVLRAEATLAVANGIYVLLLLGGGVVIPLALLPEWLARLDALLPSGALAEGLREVLLAGEPMPWSRLAVLVVWAVGAGLAAAATFRWE